MTANDLPSGLAIPIRLPPAIARIRRRWDRAARAGARPHVTVLYPFLPTSALAPDVRERIVEVASTQEPFEVTFRRVRRFDDGLVWVQAEPAEPFRRLTAAVVERWPDHPPYGGLFDEVIPHLTVVEMDPGGAGERPSLEHIERLVAARLPFTARADRLELWRQDPERGWRPCWRVPLGVSRRSR